MQVLKKPTIIETIRLNRLHWFGHVQRMEGNRIPKKIFYMNLGTTRLRGRPRNRWQDQVREDGRIVGGEGWQEKVHNRQERKKILRMARNRRKNLFFKKLKQQINNKNVNLKKFKFLKSTVTTVYSLHYKHTENIKYKRDHETLAVFETTAHNVSQFSQNQTEQT